MTKSIQNPGYVDSKALQRISDLIPSHKQRMLEILGIEPGISLLDVGCGPGTDTITLAPLVGEDGLVVGMDYDESMIKEANERGQAGRITTRIQHLVADALSIPFKSNSFDVCMAERLFQHVADTQSVIKEMVRVTKAGGRIAVADADWCTLSIDTVEIDIERRITRFLQGLVRNGYAGRQLFRLFKEQFLSHVHIEVHPIIWTDWHVFRATSLSMANLDKKLIESETVTDQELQRFFLSLENAHRCGAFFATASMMLVSGVKPDYSSASLRQSW